MARNTVKYRENSTGFTVCIPKPTLRYLDQFIRFKCAPDLLQLNIFPDAKEITESMAALQAARTSLGAPRFGDNDVLLLDVGSGCEGRTGLLFAYLTRWTCISIDPRLRRTSIPKANRWSGFQGKIEDFELPRNYPLVVIAAVHSHASLKTAWDKVTHCKERLAIALPCCVPQKIEDLQPISIRDDWGIWSEKREVRIWRQ